MNTVSFGKNEEKTWRDFVENFSLSLAQEDKFKTYLGMILHENEKINLTAITSIDGVIKYHFTDSLIISKFLDFKNINCVCDVGSGAGFPGIPLKILFPNINLILLEVTQKKINFLENVISELGLVGAQVCGLDWRTFLRTTKYEIDFFCARASLQPEELMRMFKPSCVYKNSKLVYWAALEWECPEEVAQSVKSEKPYQVGNKKES